MSPLQVQLKEFWRRLSLPDLCAAGIVAVGTLLIVLGKSGNIVNFVKFISLLCAGYLGIRFIGWWRSRLLWSLRNRLIVAYLFIALVPVVLTAVLAFISATILYRPVWVDTFSITTFSAAWRWWPRGRTKLPRHSKTLLPRCRKKRWTA